jgi:hypothetical protein
VRDPPAVKFTVSVLSGPKPLPGEVMPIVAMPCAALNAARRCVPTLRLVADGAATIATGQPSAGLVPDGRKTVR